MTLSLRERAGAARQCQQTCGDFFVQCLSIVRDSREDQMVFRLVEGFDAEERENKLARLADERLQQRDLAVVLAIAEVHLSGRKIAPLRLRYERLGERMVQPVEVRLAGPAR